MIRAIETSLDSTVSFNSLQEQFFFDMTQAWRIHHKTPKEFRSIYSSDYNIIKKIGSTIDERINVQSEQNKVQQQMKAEMEQRRLQQW